MSEPTHVVRRATTADAVQLARLAASTFTETFGHLYPPDDLASFIQSYTPAACLEILADPRMAYWLSSAEGRPAAGFALAGYCKLPVWSDNLGAQRFYGRYGFVKVGEYGFPVGRTVDREFILRR